MVLKLARAYTGMTLTQLGLSIGGKDYAAVSAGLNYFEGKLQKDRTSKNAYKAIIKILNL